MKLIKIFLLLACILRLAAGAFGAQVDDKTAASVVKGWLRFDHKPFRASLGETVKNVETFKDNTGVPLYHVVNLEPSGFVIVSAEDQAEPIIAFVDKGHFDPSPSNPLGALISRDMPARVARARAKSNNPMLQASRNKWQKLLQNAAGGPQPKGVFGGEISDLRVAPFINTLWDQGALLTVVSNMIWVNNTVWVTTHFVTNSLGDVASASVSITNTPGVFLITNGPGWPVDHSFGGMNVFVNVTNGPDSTVNNLITVAVTIPIIVTNQFGDILTAPNTILTGSGTFIDAVTGGSPGGIITHAVPVSIGIPFVVSDEKACYNYFTPPHWGAENPHLFPPGRGNIDNYVCGCVATAMAQLMYYYQWPATGVGTTCETFTVNNYSMGKNLLGGDYKGGPYNWSGMPLAPDYYSLTTNQAQAVGALTFDAGIAVHMQYAEDGSGAYMTDAKAALVNTFKYNNAIVNSVTNLDTGCFECSLYNMMNPNLDARLPVLLGITGDPGGHAIVVDGYGYSYGMLYHHLNMGWSGAYNAWYSLPIIDMYDFYDDDQYAYFWDVTECIYNVYTNGSGEIISGRVLTNGIPVAGASVTANRIGGGTYTALTDLNGIYALAGVPSASTYTLTAMNTGYYSASSNYSTTTSSDSGTTSGNVWGADFSLVSAVGPPSIVGQPESQTAIMGTTVTFSITAVGQLPLNFQWLFNGTNIIGETNTSLTLTNVQPGQAGAYSVQVTNVLNSITSSNALLTVIVPPSFITQPQDQTAVQGSNATFVVQAGGTAPLSYQWFFNGMNIIGATNTSLMLTNVQPDQAGAYSVQVTNVLNSITSSNALLTVILPPWIIFPPQNQTTGQGSNATFIVQAGGKEPLSYQWQSQLTNGSTIWTDLSDGTNFSGSWTGTLTVNQASLAMNGNPFRCIVTNSWGSATSSPPAILTIIPYPYLTIVTLAGLALNDGTNDDIGSNARFNNPRGIAVDNNNNVYVTDLYNQTIRKLVLSGTNWVVTTIAGLAGSSGSADGTNGNARFNGPYGITVSGGNLYVADTGNHTIRKLTPSGTNWMVSTIAGLAGSSGSTDSNNSNSRFRFPTGIAIDSGGNNLYVTDEGNSTIRELTPSGTNWVTSTLAGLVGHSGSTDGTNSNARFNGSYGIAVNGTDVYVADTGNHTIRKLTPSGTNWMVSTVAGLAYNIGGADGTGSEARFNNPTGIAVDGSGNLYVADEGNNTIRRLTPAGTNWAVFTAAGLAGSSGSADGTGNVVRFNGLYAIAVNNTNVFVADSLNSTIRGTPLPGMFPHLVVQMVGSTFMLSWNATMGQTYQVQYKTNLNQTAWISLLTNTASSLTDTTSIPVGPDPQRFYRIVPIPVQ